MNSACRDCLEPLVFNGKGPIFTTFYTKGLQALKVWAKIEKKLKGSTRIRTHDDTETLQT